MAKFRYRALDSGGQLVVGEVDAASRADLMARIEQTGNLPIDVDEVREGGGLAGSFRLTLSRGPRREEITSLTQDLAMLLKGGVSLDQALLILSELTGRPPIEALMRELHRGITAGKSFADVLAAHPAVFPRIYVKMVEVAEASGTLEDTLVSIARDRRRVELLRRRVQSVLTYPAFLIVAAAGVLVFVLTAIIPEFERALVGYGDRLGSAQTVFALSRLLRENSDLFLGGAIAIAAGVFFLVRSRAAGAAAFRVLSRIPGVRTVVLYAQTVFFCATLGTLTASGVDITSTLRLIRELMRDRRNAEKVDQVIAEVRQGKRLTDALANADLLPPYVVHMLRVGEEAGRLGAVATRVAGFYEEKLDRALGRLTAVLGPGIMILVAMMIAWLIVTVMTTLLSVNDLLV